VNISLACFTTLLQTYQVSAHLLDFMCCFGRPSGEMQLAPPPIQFRWHPDEGPDFVNGFDCTYILRFVEPNNRGEKNPYSLRQALVFHRCSSFSTWLFVALSKSMSLTLHSHLASRDDTLPENQFSLHLILINAAAATWRSYLSYIAEEVRNVAEQAILADFDNDGIHLGELEERQYLKQLEDMITDLMTAVDSSLDICSTLQVKHSRYAEEQSQGRAQPSRRRLNELFNQVIAEKERDFRHYRAQADVLRMRIRSAEALVRQVTISDDRSSDNRRSPISLTLVMATH